MGFTLTVNSTDTRTASQITPIHGRILAFERDNANDDTVDLFIGNDDNLSGVTVRIDEHPVNQHLLNKNLGDPCHILVQRGYCRQGRFVHDAIDTSNPNFIHNRFYPAHQHSLYLRDFQKHSAAAECSIKEHNLLTRRTDSLQKALQSDLQKAHDAWEARSTGGVIGSLCSIGAGIALAPATGGMSLLLAAGPTVATGVGICQSPEPSALSISQVQQQHEAALSARETAIRHIQSALRAWWRLECYLQHCRIGGTPIFTGVGLYRAYISDEQLEELCSLVTDFNEAVNPQRLINEVCRDFGINK